VKHVHLVLERSAGPEVLHYAAALARWLAGRGWTVSAETDPAAELERLLPPGAASPPPDHRSVAFSNDPAAVPRTGLRVAVSGAMLRLENAAETREIPFAVSPDTFVFPAKPPLDVPRLFLRGDGGASRRLRMSSKVIAELRRRHWPFELVVLGEIPDEMTRAALPDEIHPLVSAIELARLFSSVSAVLETADRREELSPAFAVGTSLGVPTFVHRDAVPAGNTSCLTVEEWSADAFADALSSHDLRTRLPREDRHLRESLHGFEKVLLG